jgi:hypothetical protein
VEAKCHNTAEQVVLSRLLYELFQELPVPQVNPVENAYRKQRSVFRGEFG